MGCPTDVPHLVVPVIVYTIERTTRRAWAQNQITVVEERPRVVVPQITNLNPTATIVLVVTITGVVTATLHAQPTAVLRVGAVTTSVVVIL